MVLDNIAEQRENPEYLSTLAALCLVSKSICAQAQPRLYHKIPFLESYVSPDVLLSRVPLGRRNGRHKIPRSLLLLYTFFSNPKLTAYVTSYTIQRLSYLGDPTGNITFEVYYSALSAVLSHMPNLRELTITTDDFTRLSTDDLFTNFDYYASLMGFHKAFINRAQKPDQIVLCCGPTAKYDEGVEKNMMAMFHPFMKRALEKISSGLIKLTIQDSFTPSGYLDPNTILAKHPTLQSLIVKDQDAFPFARYTMAEIIPPQLPDSICPNLNKFEGTLQDFFRFMPSQRNLKDVRITQTDCDMGRGRDAGQRMRFQTMRLNQDGARKGDLSGVVSPIGLRTIERLEFSDHVAQDFVFTDCVGSNEVWADGIFSNLVSLHTLVLPASFSNREEVSLTIFSSINMITETYHLNPQPGSQRTLQAPQSHPYHHRRNQ